MQLKKLLCSFFSLMILTMLIVFPASADTTDYPIQIAVGGNGGDLIYYGSESKDNSSAMYLLIETSTYYATRVRALGTNVHHGANSANTTNCTCLANGNTCSYVTCARGVDYSVHSYVYEWGYDYATYGFTNYNPSYQYISGEWSADTWNTHVDAIP